MPNFGFSELALIVVVSFFVLGPKEIPNVIRALSKFLRQCRDVIDECKAQMDAMAEEGGMKDMTTQLEAEKKYIRDQFGEMQEVYDINDFLPANKQVPYSEPDDSTEGR